jgi:tRNA threonylcarbamoyladenosine biosynthesis protein TsaB
MPSLRQLRASAAPLLLLDAASARIQVGILGSDPGADRWQSSTEEAGIGVFRCIEALGLDLASVRGFAFCEGPGSILGIRTVAMALRTWNVLLPRPVYRYGSLELVAHALAQPDAQIIADARRDTWHRFVAGGKLERVPAASLSGRLLMPEGFRHWTPLPPDVSPTSYTLAGLLTTAADADLFRVTEAPDAYLHEEPAYRTWTPQIHRAP